MSTSQKARVLIAEDDPAAAREIAASLENSGHEVAGVAASAEESFLKAEQTKPDVVLVDILIRGEVSAVDAGIRIQEALRIPVIFLAAHSELNHVKLGSSNIPHGFLVKPFVERELSAALDTALYRSRLERKLQAQRHWSEAVLNCIGDALITTDVRGTVTFMNPVAEHLTGWKRANAIGRKLYEVFRTIDEHSRKPVEASESRALRDDTAVEEEPEDILLISAEGVERPIVSTVSPINDSGGNLHGIVVVFRDLTSRKSMEQRVLNRQRMEAIGKLSRNIAHEFRNVVGVIAGYAASIQEHTAPKSRPQADAKRIIEAVDHAASFTKRILGVARAGAPSRDLDVRPAPLGGLIQNAANLLSERFEKRCVRLKVRSPGKMPLVAVDPSHFVDLLIDLFLNAVEAMPEGGRLAIDTRRHRLVRHDPKLNPKARPGKYVVLRIRDTGTGIPAQVLERIFDPFFTTKPKDSHVGLGLSVAHSAIQHYGGWISVTSEPRKGSTFSIYLPALPAEIPADITPTVAAGATILVADDDPVARIELEKILSLAGYTVNVASGGHEAIEMFRKHRQAYNLAIIDMLMPDLDGKRVLEEIGKLSPSTAVIMASGFSREYARTSLSAGSWRYLQKPFDPEAVLSAVKRTLGQGTT